MENNNNSEQKELIADVINVVINQLDAEFEKTIKEGHYSEAEELLTKAWVKVTQVATDLWWNHVISFDEMKFVTKRVYAFVENKWEKLYPYETFCSSTRDKFSSDAAHPGIAALNAIYQHISNMRDEVTMNLQHLQDDMQQQKDLLKQLLNTTKLY